MKITAIVLAAGRGSRMNSHIQKQYMLLKGEPLLCYTLRVFEKSSVDEVILVVGKGEVGFCREKIVEQYGFKKVKVVTEGGSERFYSVYEGIKAAENADYILIHDGARPFVTVEIIEDNIETVKNCGACVTAVPSKDTVKIVSQTGMIESTPDRNRVWIIQTPQSFSYKLIKSAYEQLMLQGDTSVTDDAMVVEKYMSHKVNVVMGSYSNIKITTPEDMNVAQSLVK